MSYEHEEFSGRCPTCGQEFLKPRIDALEDCLREFMAWVDAPIGPHEQLAKVIDKARALLEAND